MIALFTAFSSRTCPAPPASLTPPRAGVEAGRGAPGGRSGGGVGAGGQPRRAGPGAPGAACGGTAPPRRSLPASRTPPAVLTARPT
eukprot:3925407-Rhodomonas_salina.1